MKLDQTNQANKSKQENILSLKEIYNLDLNTVLNDVLNKDNFIGYNSIALEIIELLAKEVREDGAKLKFLETSCDKLLEFCLNRLAFSLNKLKDKYELVFNNSNPADSSQDEVLLKYIKLCSPFSSEPMQICLFKLFILSFIRLVNSKYEYLNSAMQKSFNEHLLNDSASIQNLCSHSVYDLKQINFLFNYFNLIVDESKLFRNENASSKSLFEFLTDYALNVLFGIDDNDQYVIKLCINTLSKLASINRTLVLNKCFSKLKTESLNEICFNMDKLAVEQQQNESRIQHIENKKRLESFKQDANLTLLVALSDYVMESSLMFLVNNKQVNLNENYLSRSEFWGLIQAGLMHTNSLTRKQALYLAKRTLDLAEVNKLEIKSDYFDSFYDENNQLNEVYLYQSNPAIWNDYFLCIELLEESSVSYFLFMIKKKN